MDRPSPPRALTFDCYGTLVDWDDGILAALRALPSLADADLARLVREREREELALLAGPFRLYGAILEESLRRAARLQGREVPATEARAFALGMGDWMPFPDAPRALARLSRRFTLAILSNVETVILARSVARLGASFRTLVTAEEVRSYKPARAHFDEGLRRLGLARADVLHVAGSLVHDVVPARALGFDVAWIDRRGEPRPPELSPGRVFRDLDGLADALGA
jgi:2-haloalkanoic acid dehalogenase type II